MDGQINTKSERLQFPWRLLVAITLGLIIGGWIGLLVAPDEHGQFVIMWLSGHVGGFIGFLLGVWWHFKHLVRRKKS